MPEQSCSKYQKIKLITIGEIDTGKSCIIKRFCEKRFNPKYSATIGVDYGVYKVKIRNKNVRLDIFDFAGDPIYYDIRNEFYEETNVVLLVFDVTSRYSFDSLYKWIQELSSELLVFPDPFCLCVCGNKVDKDHRQVSYFEAVEWASHCGLPYFETSASNGHGIASIFDHLLESIIDPDSMKTKLTRDYLLNKTNEASEFHSQKQFTFGFGRKDFKSFANSTNPVPNHSGTKDHNFTQPDLNTFTQQHLHEISRIRNARSDHERLGVSKHASRADINKAFRRLAFVLHPDKNAAPGSEEAFKLLVTARNTLLQNTSNMNTIYFSSGL